MEDNNEWYLGINGFGLKVEDEGLIDLFDRDGDLEEVYVCLDSIIFCYFLLVFDFIIFSLCEKVFKVVRFLYCIVFSCVCIGFEFFVGRMIWIIKYDFSNEDEDDEDEDDDVFMEDFENLLDFEDKKDEWRMKEGWWRICGKCGYGWESGGYVWVDDVFLKERIRRGKVVGRIEEIFEVGLYCYYLRSWLISF